MQYNNSHPGDNSSGKDKPVGTCGASVICLINVCSSYYSYASHCTIS